MLSENTRLIGAATVLARVGLGTAFLSAVADRFGMWGPPGTNHVFWGNFENFTEYLRVLAPYLPGVLVDPTAWGVTAVEVVLGVALLLGVRVRWAALASAATLIVFGGSMFFFSGFETPLGASVFNAAAAALLLGLTPDEYYIFRLDRLWTR